MKKAILLTFILSIIGCSDKTPEQIENERLQQQIAELQYQQQLQAQQAQANQQVNGVQPVQPQAYLPQQPVIVNQQPVEQHDNTLQNMLLGGMIGHAIGSSGNNNGYTGGYNPPRTVHHYSERVIERTPAPVSSVTPRSAVRLPSATTVKPTVSPAIPKSNLSTPVVSKPAVSKPAFSFNRGSSSKPKPSFSFNRSRR